MTINEAAKTISIRRSTANKLGGKKKRFTNYNNYVDITYYDICDLLEAKHGEKFYELDWEESCKTTRELVKELDAYYYAAERHDLSIEEAARLAYENGKRAVIIENLS